MLNITITEQTPHNMLRAIRAACNELLGETHADLTTQAAQHNSCANELHAAAGAEADKAAACLTGWNQANKVKAAFVSVQEERKLPPLGDACETLAECAADMAREAARADAPETDSSGAEWNPELHASTKAKNQDGTWKKRRGAGKADVSDEEVAMVSTAVAAPALPPLPPAPPAAPLVTMNDIYALIQNHKCVLNDVIAAAQAMGFADVGAFSRDATPEQRAQLLAQLTKEVA